MSGPAGRDNAEPDRSDGEGHQNGDARSGDPASPTTTGEAGRGEAARTGAGAAHARGSVPGAIPNSGRPVVLVVDDEPQIHRFLKPALEVAGYSVRQASTGREGLRLAAEQAPAAILLDLGLPDLDGQEVIVRLRAFSRIPLIVVSARDLEAGKVCALDRGADDYVEKPFAIGELLARLRACIRRSASGEPAVAIWRGHGVEVDLVRRRVLVAAAEVSFSPREYDLLSVLVRNAGVVLTHRQLLVAVWGSGHAEDVQYLRVYIGLIRHKLGPNGADIVLTAAGVGYRIAESAEPHEAAEDATARG